jgi:hypothetical protein
MEVDQENICSLLIFFFHKCVRVLRVRVRVGEGEDDRISERV